MDAIDAARAVVEEHHPDARAAFLGGSVMTGRRTVTSDLDIVVLLRGDPAPYRASLRHEDWPVELFVHTEASWHAYVEREVRKRRSPLLWMCADGLLLFDTDGVGARLAAEARRLAAAGPPVVATEEIEDRRYAITDLLDDLSGSGDQGERLFIATELVRRTGELALAMGGSWGGGGKWLARRLESTAPGLVMRLHHALGEVLEGRDDALVVVVDEVLERAGGRLWDGYQRGGVTPS
ncbi:nucleotidyltransferase domain-containing protein [Streptomyces sp. NPDC002643]